MKKLFTSWKIKRFFKRQLEPKKSFEDWAIENGIIIETQKQAPKKKLLLRWASATSAFIIFAILLPTVILPNLFPSDPPIDAPIIYSSQDAKSNRTTIDELYQIDNLLLFERNQIMTHSGVFMDVPIENESITLSYTLDNVFLITKDEANGFYVNYKIRVYKDYNFYSYDLYSNLNDTLLIGNIKINYNIVDEGLSSQVGYITFAHQSYDYFLRVTGFPDVTEINDNTIQLLIADLFSEHE